VNENSRQNRDSTGWAGGKIAGASNLLGSRPLRNHWISGRAGFSLVSTQVIEKKPIDLRKRRKFWRQAYSKEQQGWTGYERGRLLFFLPL